MSLPTYEQLISRYRGQVAVLNRKLGWLSALRLIFFIAIIFFGYRYLVSENWFLLVIAVLCLAAFLYCIRLYDRIKASADFNSALLSVNETELIFLTNPAAAGFEEGEEYADPHHPYSHDLDIFGPGSLYQYLNRTKSFFGKEKLATALLRPDATQVKQRQDAIHELSDRIGFRQHIQALGARYRADQKDLNRLNDWIKAPSSFRSPLHYYVLLVFPLITLASLCIYIFSDADKWLNIFFGLFTLNLFITFSFARKIMKQMAVSGKITQTLQAFAGQFDQIEKQDFQSPLLQQLQERLKKDRFAASSSISRLSSLFGYLDYIINLVVSIFLNGFFIFHIHILYALDKWKEKNKDRVMDWLEVIGEIEALNCFANFEFNNRDFCYPQCTTEEEFSAVQMGHPLIRSEKRIYNDVSFEPAKFVVLTGSNMSGKSTFLRTLGINLVLARAGSATCATRFTFYPYELHASMRITDSLQDSESFFYAELRRLHEIILHFNSGAKTFVLLDEILRGTNSDDKHSGTVGLIRKLAAYKVCGIIATHDLTIANLSAEYPGYMGNKCFESLIVNDELFFDYKLKEGVCNSLNASFLMKKMGIIDN